MPYKDKEYHKQYRRERSAKMTQWLRDYKVEKGCADCGWNDHHAGLELDHILPGKRFNVGQAPHYSMEVMLKELSICEVVCGTCHNIRTFNRRNL